MRLERVLFPTDFSDAAENALRHALEVARKFDARITILHVRTLFADDPNQPEFQLLDQGKYESSVEEQLAMMTEGVETSDRVDTVMERNLSAASGILTFVEDHRVDMVVMGTHGRSALSRFFLGSVAEKVVRHASCPVMTVGHGKSGYRNSQDYRKILATFDFSEISKEAVRRGQQFAQAYGAEIEVLYVVEQVIPPPLDKIWQVSVKSEVPEVISSARESLKNTLGQEEFDQVKLEVRVGDADGKAEGEIVSYARENEFDLVIMGTHGLSGIDHALLGSTTERVVRTAPCPVLTFHQRPKSTVSGPGGMSPKSG